MEANFRTKLIERMRKDRRRRHTDNFDSHRFARELSTTPWWKRFAIHLGALQLRAIARTRVILKHADDLEWTYQHLKDDESRNWLVSVMAYRAMGRKRVKLDSNNSERLRNIERIENSLLREKSSHTFPNGQTLDDFDLHQMGIPIVLRGGMGSVLYPFILKQYELNRGDYLFKAMPGDVVIDGGGCYGDTALYFANVVGQEGLVYCYEFDPHNIDIYDHNMHANPEFGKRVRLMKYALWNVPGKIMGFVVDGASTRITSSTRQTRPANTTVTDTIDAMTERVGVSRIDLIKMDIEGAELAALQGARNTILRDRPKLAICLYHQLDHFWKVPQFIDSLGCGYEFRISHFTIHAEETVLFAEVVRA